MNLEQKMTDTGLVTVLVSHGQCTVEPRVELLTELSGTGGDSNPHILLAYACKYTSERYF